MKNRVFSLLSIIILFLMILSNFSRIAPNEAAVRIAVSDDMSGFVVDHIINKNTNSLVLEAYFIKDCCAKTSQWAMTSDLVDMGIICVSAAEVFTENNPSFMIYAPVAMNTDVFLVKDEDVKSIGITQNRHYQEKLVKDFFSESVEISPMIGQALPYAFEKNEIQGAVIDVTKAIHLNGKITGAGDKEDYVSYVLVVDKEFVKTKDFSDFEKHFNQSTKILMENDEKYDKHLSEYLQVETIEKGVHKKWKVKLLSIEES